MRGYRSDDRESFESRISKKPSIISRALHRGITPRHRRQTRFVHVTDPAQFRRFVLHEIPQEVRPPIAAANNSNRSRVHKTSPKNSGQLRKSESFGQKPDREGGCRSGIRATGKCAI